LRYPDWTERLWRTLDAAARKPFAYGIHDCIILSASCLDSMIRGGRYLEQAGRLYRDKRSALRLILRSGLDELVSLHLGEPVSRGLVRSGDPGSVDLETGPAVGIVVNARIAVAASPTGVEFLPIERMRFGWRVE
jgi:hypothetical protein